MLFVILLIVYFSIYNIILHAIVFSVLSTIVVDIFL